MDNESKTNRPILPGIDAMLMAVQKVSDAARSIQDGANQSVENIDSCLESIDAMEDHLKEFYAGQMDLIEKRTSVDKENLKQLSNSQSASFKKIRSTLEANRKSMTDEEYSSSKPLMSPLVLKLERPTTTGVASKTTGFVGNLETALSQ